MSDLRLPVEVEPVSDARWERIGREMFARLDASGAPIRPLPQPKSAQAFRRRVATWTVLAAAVAAIGFLVVRPRGTAHSDNRARLETTGSASQFTVGESALIVAPQSLVMVSGDDDHGIDVVLDRGAVTCIVAPRKGRPPFVVDAGEVHVRVVGTKFTIARDADGASVDVDHGVVEVTTRGAVTALHDGEHWPAPLGGPAATVPQPHAELVVPDAPVSNPPSAPTVILPVRPRGTSLPEPPLSPSPTPPPPIQDLSLPAAATATPAPPPAPKPSPQDRFESAAKIERARPDEAATVYRQLAAGTSPWASNALFALARLEVDRGRRADAARHLRDYLAQYPRGINADDARTLLQHMQ